MIRLGSNRHGNCLRVSNCQPVSVKHRIAINSTGESFISGKGLTECFTPAYLTFSEEFKKQSNCAVHKYQVAYIG